LSDWQILQDEISVCEVCRQQFPTIRVDCPPGLILPPDLTPPNPVKILFVGVAPPEKGRHFYTASQDNLRDGLFKTLTELGRPCRSMTDFLAHNFLLLHTAKCAIKGTTSPNLSVAQFCAVQHLKREIELLRPEAVCWLSKSVGYPVCRTLSQKWGTPKVPFGTVFSVSILGRDTRFIATNWPGRGWEKDTKEHLRRLLDTLSS